MAKWIKEDLSAEVGNLAIEHDEQCALAALSRRWFAMVFREWEGHWPRVQRAGFAIRSDLFKKIGGFDSRYGQFAPQVLSARLHLQKVTVKTIPGASVVDGMRAVELRIQRKSHWDYARNYVSQPSSVALSLASFQALSKNSRRVIPTRGSSLSAITLANSPEESFCLMYVAQ